MSWRRAPDKLFSRGEPMTLCRNRQCHGQLPPKSRFCPKCSVAVARRRAGIGSLLALFGILGAMLLVLIAAFSAHPRVVIGEGVEIHRSPAVVENVHFEHVRIDR